MGAIVLALLLEDLGWLAIRDAACAIGPWLAAIAVIDVCGLCCDAGAIASFARPARLSLRGALAAQATGYAINQLTPGSSLGEPVKVAIAAGEVPRDAAISAVVLYNVATVAVGVAAIAIGAPIALCAIDLPGSLALAAWLALATLVAAVIAAIALVRRGPLGAAIGGMRRVRAISAVRAARWRARTAAIDARLRTFGDARSRRGLAFAIASRLLHWAGTLIVLRAIATPVAPAFAIGVLALGVAIGWASAIMPFGLGIADTGQCTLFALLGGSAEAGLAFAMVDRARSCLLALIAAAIGSLASAARRAQRSVRLRRVAGLA